MAVDHFVLHSRQLVGASIIHIRHLGSLPNTTDAFVETAQDAGLNGFDSVKVWPCPNGVEWAKKRKE